MTPEESKEATAERLHNRPDYTLTVTAANGDTIKITMAELEDGYVAFDMGTTVGLECGHPDVEDMRHMLEIAHDLACEGIEKADALLADTRDAHATAETEIADLEKMASLTPKVQP